MWKRTDRPLIRMFGWKILSRLLKDKQDAVKSLVEEDDRRQREGFEMGRVMSVEQTVKHCFNEIVEPLNYVKTSTPTPPPPPPSFLRLPCLILNNRTKRYVSPAESHRIYKLSNVYTVFKTEGPQGEWGNWVSNVA